MVLGRRTPLTGKTCRQCEECTDKGNAHRAACPEGVFRYRKDAKERKQADEETYGTDGSGWIWD